MILSMLMAHIIDPGPRALPLYMLMDASWYVALMAIESGLRAMLGDIVDFGQLKSGEQRAGEFAAVWSLVTKGALAAGTAVAYQVVARFGFDPAAATITPEGVTGMKLSMGALPATLMLPALALAFAYPLTRARAAVVRRSLERRADRAERNTAERAG
jgi:Na+/melibiose symporter-like transporter